MSPFDIIGGIVSSHDDKWEEIGEKDYNSFMVNRGLSYYPDCVMLANEINRRYHIPKQMQYLFFLESVTPKKKRFAKWASSKKDSEIQLVADYYQVSLRKAAAIRNLLSDQDMSEVSRVMNKGGV